MSNMYNMSKKSWKRFCDKKNTINQRKANKEKRATRFKKDSCLA